MIKGQGQINGDLDCDQLNLQGGAEIIGDIKTKAVDIKGISQIKGSLEAESMEINGQTTIKGQTDTKQFEVEGFVTIGSGLSAEEINVKGGIHIDGDCNGETFLIKGAFTIGGLLNAGRIEVALFGGSKAREIGGGSIQIKLAGRLFGSIHHLLNTMFNLPDGLVADTIEGDDINLENTKAKVVRGNNVPIGKDCEIELVEYKNQFQQVPKAKITGARKI